MQTAARSENSTLSQPHNDIFSFTIYTHRMKKQVANVPGTYLVGVFIKYYGPSTTHTSAHLHLTSNYTHHTNDITAIL